MPLRLSITQRRISSCAPPPTSIFVSSNSSSLASSSFEPLFESPQPTEASGDREIKDGLVVVHVRESSKTLDTLLRFCYPCTLAEDPELEVLKDLVDDLEAAHKYSLHTIERRVYRALSNPKILEAEPFRCFAITLRGRTREETLLAAKYTLTQPLIPAWFQEIDLISAADLLALLTYHQKCGDAVYTLKNGLSWIESHYGSSQGCAWLPRKSESSNTFGAFGQAKEDRGDPTCRCARSTIVAYRLFKLQPPSWWEGFMTETFAALRDNPCRETVESFAPRTVQTVRAQNCPICSVNISDYMRVISGLFTAKVEEVVSKVRCVIITFRDMFTQSRHVFRSRWRWCSNCCKIRSWKIWCGWARMLVRTQKKCLSILCKRLIFIRAPTSVMMGLIRGSRADLCHSLDFITVRTGANITPTCQCWFSVSSNIIITRHTVNCSTRQ